MTPRSQSHRQRHTFTFLNFNLSDGRPVRKASTLFPGPLCDERSWERVDKASCFFPAGFLCPVHTPDGAPCGLLNHMAADCKVTHLMQLSFFAPFPSCHVFLPLEVRVRVIVWFVWPIVLLTNPTRSYESCHMTQYPYLPPCKVVCQAPQSDHLRRLLCSLGMVPGEAPPPNSIRNCYTVLLDGRVLGRVDRDLAQAFVNKLRMLKVTGQENVRFALDTQGLVTQCNFSCISSRNVDVKPCHTMQLFLHFVTQR